MSKMLRGNVYLVDPRDAIGCEQDGERPALVVSNNQGNRHAQVVETVYLTTQLKPDIPTHVTVYLNGVESTVMCEQITTLSKERIIKYLGRISDNEMNLVNEALKISLDL